MNFNPETLRVGTLKVNNERFLQKIAYSEIHFNKFLQRSVVSSKVSSFTIPNSNFESKLLRARSRISSTGWINFETVSTSWFDILNTQKINFEKKTSKLFFQLFENETISSQSSVYFFKCNLFTESPNLLLVIVRFKIFNFKIIDMQNFRVN